MATGGKKKLFGFMHRASHEICLIIQGELLIFNDATKNGSAIEFMMGKFLWDFLKFFEFTQSDGNEQYKKQHKKGRIMRYRIYFKKGSPVEVTGYNIRVTRSRQVSVSVLLDREVCGGSDVDIGFIEPIERIADDHDRTIYEI